MDYPPRREASTVAGVAVPRRGEVISPGVVDLLGVLAYGELSAFDRLAEDARAAPTLTGRAALSEMAAAEAGHYVLLRGHMADRGVDVAEAMSPFVALLDDFHVSTAPNSWLESLVKAYVGDGWAADLYRTLAEWLDEETRQLVLAVLADTGHAAFAQREVEAACLERPVVRDKLALWARRLLGEAITHAQHVLAERDGLAELIISGSGNLASIGVLFKTVQQEHRKRMAALGLA
jgi:hypothetical protein